MSPPHHKRSTDEVFSEPQRLHKVLASCGFGSRRAMEELILAGRITVNRMPAEIGQKVGPGDEVRINGEPVKIRFAEPRPRVLLYHKPAGEIVTRDDPEERVTVFEQLPPITDGKWIAVGRLDYNTEGLLLFTNSGELANRLMHPRYEVEREYAVRIVGRLSDEQVRALTTGIELEDGPAKCDQVEDGGGEDEGTNHWYNVVLKEGRNREVRRLFEALGIMVSRLLRTRYGKVAMPAQLKRGEWIELEPGAVAALLNSVGLRGQGGKPQDGPHAQRPKGPGGKPHHAGGQGPHRGRPHGKQHGKPGQHRRGAQRHGGIGDGAGGSPRPYGHAARSGQPLALTVNGQPQLMSHAQPQLTLHAHPPRPPGVDGAGGPGNKRRKRRRGKGGAGGAPGGPGKQRWEGLPKDEEEVA